MESLIGVVIGGLISIITTVVMDHRNAQRELRHRWDADGLDAIETYIEAVNRAIGALYDEGVSRVRDGADSDRLAQFDRTARSAMDATRVAHARVRLVMRRLDAPLSSYQAALQSLKSLADAGFESDDPRWKTAQRHLGDTLDALLAAAGETLKIQPT